MINQSSKYRMVLVVVVVVVLVGLLVVGFLVVRFVVVGMAFLDDLQLVSRPWFFSLRASSSIKCFSLWWKNPSALLMNGGTGSARAAAFGSRGGSDFPAQNWYAKNSVHSMSVFGLNGKPHKSYCSSIFFLTALQMLLSFKFRPRGIIWPFQFRGKNSAFCFLSFS